MTVAGMLLLVGCSRLILAPSGPNAAKGAPKFAIIEPFEGELTSATGCSIRYRLYRPAEDQSSTQASTLVILAHGFLRSQQRMSGLAEAIAAEGIPVATLDLCNMRFWDGRHQQNGLDMIALARHLEAGAGAGAVAEAGVGVEANAVTAGARARAAMAAKSERADGAGLADDADLTTGAGLADDAGLTDAAGLADGIGIGKGDAQVIYAGFSAGALAALVAARNDPNALGAVTLDLVDAQGIGQRAVRDLEKPLIGLAGESTNCNAYDNARELFSAADQARLLRIAGAGHCDFEAPTDVLCELVCTDPDQADAKDTAQLREQIQSQTLAAIDSLRDGAAGD